MSYMNDDCGPFGIPYPKEEESTLKELPLQRPLSKDGKKYVLYRNFGELHILKDDEIKWGKVYPISKNQLLEIVNEFNELNEEKEDWKNNCLKSVSENNILWNEISILREQGAEPSDAFKNYLNGLKNKNKKLQGDME